MKGLGVIHVDEWVFKGECKEEKIVGKCNICGWRNEIEQQGFRNGVGWKGGMNILEIWKRRKHEGAGDGVCDSAYSNNGNGLSVGCNEGSNGLEMWRNNLMTEG